MPDDDRERDVIRDYVRALTVTFIPGTDGEKPTGDGTMFFIHDSVEFDDDDDFPPQLPLAEIVRALVASVTNDFPKDGRGAVAARLREYADKVERGEFDPH